MSVGRTIYCFIRFCTLKKTASKCVCVYTLDTFSTRRNILVCGHVDGGVLCYALCAISQAKRRWLKWKHCRKYPPTHSHNCSARLGTHLIYICCNDKVSECQHGECELHRRPRKIVVSTSQFSKMCDCTRWCLRLCVLVDIWSVRWRRRPLLRISFTHALFSGNDSSSMPLPNLSCGPKNNWEPF